MAVSALRSLLRRAHAAGWQVHGLYQINDGSVEHVWKRGTDRISLLDDRVEYTGPTCRIRVQGEHDPAALARLGEVLGLLPEDHPGRACTAPDGEADTALSATGAPAPPAGAPALDPDAPPYASPFAYRAERGWQLT